MDDDTAAEGSDFVQRLAEAAEKRLAEARIDLDKAESNYQLAVKRLADAKMDKDKENINQCKDDAKHYRTHVSVCRTHMHKMIIALEEALNPCKFI